MENQKKHDWIIIVGILAVILVAVLGIACIIINVIRQVQTATTINDMQAMQNITLTITATAIALVTIINALQNYDREKKDRILEENLNKKIEEERQRLEDSIKRFEAMESRLKNNIFVLFDSNSDDDIYLNVRIANYRKLRDSDPENINVAMALIDALARSAKTDIANEKEAHYNEIVEIADELMKPGNTLDPLEKLSLQIKRANACYKLGRQCMDFKGADNKEKARAYFDDAYSNFYALYKERKDKDAVKCYLAGYLGLCTFWQYKSGGEKDPGVLRTSINYYDESLNHYQNDLKMKNSSIVAKHNYARTIQDTDAKINELKKVRDEYEEVISQNPGRQKAWVNVAGVDADIVHIRFGIDIRKESYELNIPDRQIWEEIREYCEDGMKHIAQAMIINPGFFDLYYKYADLASCMSLVSEKDERKEWLAMAETRIDFAKRTAPDSKQLKDVIRLYEKCCAL